MLIKLNADMQHAIERTVRLKMTETVVIDVAATAEEIRLAFLERNIAHEDIAASVARFASTCGFPLQFSGSASREAVG
jgi:hypothetical protein